MSADLLETLPLAHRLALSYAPRQSRDAGLGLLALDARLAGIVRTDGEAIIAQMKLAWWRDRLSEDPANWPVGEPLLELLAASGIRPDALVGLVDGWEGLLAEKLTIASIDEFADGRGQAWQAVTPLPEDQLSIARQAGVEHAYFELYANLSDAEEKELAGARILGASWKKAALPAALRPLAVLHGLARRALNRNEWQLLHGPGAMLAAMRVGILGR